MEKFTQWFSNFWYHYKLHILAVLFCAVILIIACTQIIYGKKIDVNIIYAGPQYFSSEMIRDIERAFEQAMSFDYNGDGVKGAVLLDMTLLTDEQIREMMTEAEINGEGKPVFDPIEISNLRKKLEMEIFAGESVICLFDPYWYRYILDAQGLRSLSEILGYEIENTVEGEGYGIYLKDAAFGQYFSVLSALPEDTILCIRRMTTTSIFKGVKKEETRYSWHVAMFKDIINFKLKTD